MDGSLSWRAMIGLTRRTHDVFYGRETDRVTDYVTSTRTLLLDGLSDLPREPFHVNMQTPSWSLAPSRKRRDLDIVAASRLYKMNVIGH